MKKRPNLLLRAVVICLIIAFGRELLHMYAVTHTFYFDGDNTAMMMGKATATFLMVFIPVALVVWAWQAVVDLFTRGKKPPPSYL